MLICTSKKEWLGRRRSILQMIETRQDIGEDKRVEMTDVGF